MFPSIDNQLGIEQFRTKLIEFSHCLYVPVECIVEVLKICLKNNCSKYREQYWLQENGTTMGSKNSCSYADIVAEFIDTEVLKEQSFLSLNIEDHGVQTYTVGMSGSGSFMFCAILGLEDKKINLSVLLKFEIHACLKCQNKSGALSSLST